mgnify:CR=1 FL=1
MRPAVRSHSPAVVLELPPAVQGLSAAEIKSVYSISAERMVSERSTSEEGRFEEELKKRRAEVE